MEKTTIDKFLRRRREELKLTQRQIALNVGVTESAVSRWKSGEIGNMRRDRIKFRRSSSWARNNS